MPRATHDPQDRIRQRAALLALAESLGSVAEACRRSGVTRTQYYQYKQRYQRDGLAGLKDKPPVPRSRPHAASVTSLKRVSTLALAHPAMGCNRLEKRLAEQGVRLSAVTIQKHLNQSGIGSQADRWRALERQVDGAGLVLSDEQTAFVEKHNPCFRERSEPPLRPGQQLAQSVLPVGHLPGIGRLFLHAAVDPYCGYAFALLHGFKRPEAAMALLYSDVLPFYEHHDLAPETIVTDNGREFCGNDAHPYELYLQLNGIVHRRLPLRSRPNGFSEGFHGAVRTAFASLDGTLLDRSLACLQADFAVWLEAYNRTPQPGYPLHGRAPDWAFPGPVGMETVTEAD